VDAEGSALRALWRQAEGRSQHPSPRVDITPVRLLQCTGRDHTVLLKAVTTQTGTKKKPRLCEPGLSCAVSSRLWRVVIAVTLRGAGQFAQRCGATIYNCDICATNAHGSDSSI
jgi:hypothetical protein